MLPSRLVHILNLIFWHFTDEESCGLEKLNALLEVTGLVSSGTRVQTQPTLSGGIQYHPVALPELCTVNQDVLAGVTSKISWANKAENCFMLYQPLRGSQCTLDC